MKLKFFQRKTKGSDNSTPLKSDSSHNPAVPARSKVKHSIETVPMNDSSVIQGTPAQMLAATTATGLLALPRDLHIDVLGKFLNPGDWARLAATCQALRPIYSHKINIYKDELVKYVTELVPPAVLSDPVFERFPINYPLLGKILKKSGPIIKMMTNFNFEPWQIAALLGMEEAVEMAWYDAQRRNKNAVEGSYHPGKKDAKGYTLLHYEVVGGDRAVVENHITRIRIPSASEYYELAEIAAAAGSVEVIDLIRGDSGIFNMQWQHQKSHMTFADWAFKFDQEETVAWLLEQGTKLNAWRDESQVSLHRDANVASVVYAACREGNLQLLKELTEKFGDRILKTSDSNYRTALHYAFMSDNSTLIEWLVEEHRLSLSAEDASGKTPLHVLAEAAQKQPTLWRNLPTIAKNYGIEYVTKFRDKSSQSVKDYLESAGQPDVLSEINEMCRHQHGLK